jgi:hypothetical protein
MLIESIKSGPSWAVVILELETRQIAEQGKIEITSRWSAISKQISRELNINFPLLQINADQVEICGNVQYQKFTLFFGIISGDDNVGRTTKEN